ncbi:CIC11C00000001557 [Sungouiella intermedia]|uniref:intramembrane prenyl-peptidase Rce1 n=1 Tax=Sungouiella intermedia TaxID=45354 RepID=A0A1L0D7B6_9ASCO|nr:CIC11C00000001557 [[Candida] intermedia]
MLLPWIASVALATSYVTAIRFHQPLKISLLDRNDPLVIKYRFSRISTLCLAMVILLPWILSVSGNYADYPTALRQFGLFPGFCNTHSFKTDICNVFLALFKILLLYCGPIANYVVTGQARMWKQDFHDEFMNIWGFRDHVFAPVSEELVYRAGVVSILRPYSSHITVYSPFLFGLAHVHHGIQLYRDKYPVSQILLSVFVQLVYTSLFGMLANYMYISSGENLWCPIVVHGVCNLIGFPSFDMRENHPRWFWVYCGMLFIGVVMFFKVL